MAENKKVMEEEAVDTKETKAEQTCEETKDTKETAAEETKETAAEEKDTKKEEKSEKKGAFGKKKKDKKDEQIEDLNDRLKRQMAEFDNFRKRTEKEKAQMFDMGARTIIEKILPVIDNFERGLAAVPEEQKIRISTMQLCRWKAKSMNREQLPRNYKKVTPTRTMWSATVWSL